MRMKKFLFSAAVLMIAACGSKTGNNANGADSTVQDTISSTVQNTIPSTETEADLQKAIETQLQTIYGKLHEMDASGHGINVNELDQQFCSEEFLKLQKEVYKKSENATSCEEAFSDEGWRWFPDISAAQTVKAHQHLVMLLENGQWKIHNWIDPEAFPEGNYLDWMKLFLNK